MLLMIEKGVRRGICYAIHSYAKNKNIHMKNYYKSKELSCLKY